MIKVFTFSEHVRNYLINEGFFGPNKISVVKHPTDINITQKFNVEKFKSNSDKCIVQIGQQQRYYDTIYKINVPEYRKIWLPGNKSLCQRFTRLYPASTVLLLYLDDYQEYYELISKNVILCHLIDANANNAVIEALVRNVPLVINRHPAVEEYLGKDYPLYFSTIEEIPSLLTESKIIAGHEYLSKKDKSFLSIQRLSSTLIGNIYV